MITVAIVGGGAFVGTTPVGVAVLAVALLDDADCSSVLEGDEPRAHAAPTAAATTMNVTAARRRNVLPSVVMLDQVRDASPIAAR